MPPVHLVDCDGFTSKRVGVVAVAILKIEVYKLLQ